MRPRTHAFLCALLLTLTTAGAQTSVILSKKSVDIRKWEQQHFSQGQLPPFSFRLDGQPSERFITRWRYSKSPSPYDNGMGDKWTRYTYADPQSGLKVHCDVAVYPDFDAVEWILRLENTGAANSAEISDVRECCLDFRFPKAGLTVHYSNGSFPSRSDFAPVDKAMVPGDSLALRPRGGRSSETVMPFFNLESPASAQGVVMAIGWTGTWRCLMTAPTSRDLAVQSGLDNFASYLEPGESIRLSSVALCFWQGNDSYIGNNRFRRLILAHHTRKIDGKAAIYPVSFGFSWGDPAPCNEYSCLTAKMAAALLERQHLFGLRADVSWLDAGWYQGADRYEAGKTWANTVGNWQVNTEHFPNGLKEVSDEVHKYGRKFMVWFEPERVSPGTQWYTEHADWLLLRQPGGQGLLNLGLPEANDFLCHFIGDFLQEQGIDYYRQDFNIHPELYWRQADPAGRKGITEVKYINGLYRYWDYLLKRFPSLLIDNCASGGNRLDWETILRSAPLWRTDDCNYSDPSDMQCHTYGISLWLPQSGTGMGFPDRADKYSLRSCMSSAMIYNWKILTRAEDFRKMRACQQEFDKVRPYFLEDYYPLSDNAHTDARDNWLAYQLYSPAKGSGYVVAFRRHLNPDSLYTVRLHALRSNTLYRLTNEDTGETVEHTGRELTGGLQLKLSKPDSSLLLYFEEKR